MTRTGGGVHSGAPNVTARRRVRYVREFGPAGGSSRTRGGTRQDQKKNEEIKGPTRTRDSETPGKAVKDGGYVFDVFRARTKTRGKKPCCCRLSGLATGSGRVRRAVFLPVAGE